MTKAYLADALTDYVKVVIDPLGAETPEQKEERKASPAIKRFNQFILGVVLVLGAIVFWMMGVYQGASDPDFWNDLPLVEAPSQATEE